MSLEAETETVMTWMRYLTSREVHQALLQKREELRDLQLGFLFEVGEIHVKELEEEKSGDTNARKPLLNGLLSVIEIYLLIIHCFLQKRNYMEQLLNPHSPDLVVLNQQAYYKKLEKVVQAEILRAGALQQRYPQLKDMVKLNFEEMPWRALQLPCFQGDGAGESGEAQGKS